MNSELQLMKPNPSHDPVVTGLLQRKHSHAQTGAQLTVGPANDRYEHEADRIADRVLQTPLAQRSVSGSDFSSVPARQGIIMRQATGSSQPINLFPPTSGNVLGPSSLPQGILPKPAGKDCGANTGNILSQQPVSLQAVVRQSDPNRVGSNPDTWFAGLGAMQHVLTSIFNRLCEFGVWPRVNKVRFVTPGEKPLGPFEVPGYAGTAAFVADDRHTLMSDLLATGRFCADSPIGSSQHQGQASFREVSRSDSLHIAVGPGNNFDAHIDRYSSPQGGGGSVCEYDPVSSAAHLGREVISGKIRSKTGIPGIQVFPEATPGSPGGNQHGEQAPPSILGLRLDF